MNRKNLATIVSIFAGIAGALLPGYTVAASAPCAPRPAVVDQLATGYGERQVGLGLVQNGWVMELWAGPSGNWTLLATLPTGISCVVAAGGQLELLPPPEAPANPA